MAHVICVASQKGGTGKTTTAVNLAASLALFERRTLLVDCDPSGNATTSLGIDKRSLSLDLHQALTGEALPFDVIVESHLAFLNIIPARFQLIQAESELISDPEKQTALQKLLHNYRNIFEYIILDSPASLGFFTISALAAAEWVVIPLQLQIHNLESVSQLLIMSSKVRETYNPKLKIAGFLLTMCDDPSLQITQFPPDSRKSIENKIFTTRIPRDSILRNSVDLPKPLVLYDIDSKGAQAYLALTKEIIQFLKVKVKTVDKNIDLNDQ